MHESNLAFDVSAAVRCERVYVCVCVRTKNAVFARKYESATRCHMNFNCILLARFIFAGIFMILLIFAVRVAFSRARNFSCQWMEREKKKKQCIFNKFSAGISLQLFYVAHTRMHACVPCAPWCRMQDTECTTYCSSRSDKIQFASKNEIIIIDNDVGVRTFLPSSSSPRFLFLLFFGITWMWVSVAMMRKYWLHTVSQH